MQLVLLYGWVTIFPDCFEHELDGSQVTRSGCHMQASPAEIVYSEKIGFSLEQDFQHLDVFFFESLVVQRLECLSVVTTYQLPESLIHARDLEVDIIATVKELLYEVIVQVLSSIDKCLSYLSHLLSLLVCVHF